MGKFEPQRSVRRDARAGDPPAETRPLPMTDAEIAAEKAAIDRRCAIWLVPGVVLSISSRLLKGEFFASAAPFRSLAGPLLAIGYLLVVIAFLRWSRPRRLNPFWALLLAHPGLYFLVPRDIRDEFEH